MPATNGDDGPSFFARYITADPEKERPKHPRRSRWRREDYAAGFKTIGPGPSSACGMSVNSDLDPTGIRERAQTDCNSRKARLARSHEDEPA